MQLTMTDKGLSVPSMDQLSIIVFRAKGGVWYANNWDGTKATEAVICAGDVTTSGVTGTSTSTPIVTTGIRDLQISTPVDVKMLTVKAYPNPSITQFTIQVKSDNIKDAISMKVYDIFGRVLETRTNLSAGQTIQIGAAYRSGIYIIDVIQNGNHQQVKLFKEK